MNFESSHYTFSKVVFLNKDKILQNKRTRDYLLCEFPLLTGHWRQSGVFIAKDTLKAFDNFKNKQQKYMK